MHIPVLLDESITYLDPKPGGHFIDGTLGGGGHAAEIIKRIAPGGSLLGIDLDPNAIAAFEARVKDEGWGKRVLLRQGNFSDIHRIAKEAGFPPADGVIVDLGMSSDQLGTSRRGFSFQNDEPLMMTYDPSSEITAAAVINSYPEEALRKIIRDYSGERFAGRIAQSIVRARKKKRIITTNELVSIIEQAVPKGYERGRIHPATRTFMAIRIAVNREPEHLWKFLQDAQEVVRPGGRLVVISFQSLEDRVVKDVFREKQRGGIWTILTKKPIVPSEQEEESNPRSRSAKFRAAERMR